MFSCHYVQRVTIARAGMLAGFLLFATHAGAADGYQYYLTGNPENVERTTQGLIVAQGGGDDVDENYIQMGLKGGGGDFVVLRASGEDGYNEYIFELCQCDSVETLVFNNREAASDPFVIKTIRNAEALFIAGGDQSNYVKFWQNTPVQDAINFVVAKPAPIGGTSAGMAVLGEFVYSAMTESVTTESGLGDPFNADLTLAKDFLDLPFMNNIITDQHLQERHRIGRTLAFMARLEHDGWTEQSRAIAADRETAVHVDPETGIARVFATADHETPYAYFMRSSGKPERCSPGEPLTFRNIQVYRIGPGGSFDIGQWSGEGGISYTLGAEDGKLVSSRESAY
ncbi:MAG: cyanophycinase [Gammaproteobacteria bacterium]|nr:cyanophycinase [Gammaproteobacteria bacterium]